MRIAFEGCLMYDGDEPFPSQSSQDAVDKLTWLWVKTYGSFLGGIPSNRSSILARIVQKRFHAA